MNNTATWYGIICIQYKALLSVYLALVKLNFFLINSNINSIIIIIVII
jgi:hypothetical protein